jgi:erythritol kinase
MIDGTTHHDPLAPEAAAITGLRAGTPVALGPIDATSNALGSGLYHRTGKIGVSVLGSAGLHFRLYRDAGDVVLPDEQVGYTMPFPVPGTWCSFVSQMAATLNLDWLAGIVAEAAGLAGARRVPDEILAMLSSKAADAPPGTLLYQPHIAAAGERGPFVDSSARAGWVGITSETGLGDLARAVFEAIGLGARACYDALDHRPREIRLTGGASRNPLMRAVLAAAVGAPVRVVTRTENGAAGAALVAAVSVGRHRDVVAALETWVEPHLAAPEIPDPDLQDLYRRHYPASRDAHRVLRPLWHALRPQRQPTGDDR